MPLLNPMPLKSEVELEKMVPRMNSTLDTLEEGVPFSGYLVLTKEELASPHLDYMGLVARCPAGKYSCVLLIGEYFERLQVIAGELYAIQYARVARLAPKINFLHTGQESKWVLVLAGTIQSIARVRSNVDNMPPFRVADLLSLIHI